MKHFEQCNEKDLIIKEMMDDHFEHLQELLKILEIEQEMPPNLDGWEEIINNRIKELKETIKKLKELLQPFMEIIADGGENK